MYHETAGATSNLFRDNNNMFGMKYPDFRETMATTSDVFNFAVFESLESSVRDLELWWWDRGYDINDFFQEYDYVKKLKELHYFEDDSFNYLKGIRNGMNFYNNV